MQPGQITRRGLIAGGAVMVGGALAARAFSGGSAQPAGQPPQSPIKTAVLIDDGATLIDFAGFYQALGTAGGAANVPGFDLYAVAPEMKVYTIFGDLQVRPNHTFADAPPADLVHMGAQSGVQKASPDKLAFIKSAYDRGALITSACTGSLILAQTGLLNGLEATSHHDFFDQLGQYPNVKVVRDRRVVPQGRIVTAGGEACSLDLGLWVVAKYYGKDAAIATAKYMEYLPNPPIV